ncbi:MAG: class I SAM-dependent methyltransferase [Gemmatimonadota bacterium]|nr:MAG: class I SAM-dependent methyltransferase [Gemmatimonadota bacterium]
MEQAPDDWYANEEFWAETYAYMFPASRFEAGAQDVQKLIELTGCRGGALLDLCCGPGRHAVPFARRGFRVTGVDRTSYLLEKARAFAAEEDVEVEWVAEDMRRFVRPDTFDLALSLLTSWGYFDEPDENQLVLENVRRSLKPGGCFILDTIGKEVIARIFEATYSTELDDRVLLVQRRQVIDDWSRMENEWLLVSDGGVRSFRLRHWLYSGRELRLLLAAAGFQDIVLYGDLDGLPYGPGANRMIAVARR